MNIYRSFTRRQGSWCSDRQGDYEEAGASFVTVFYNPKQDESIQRGSEKSKVKSRVKSKEKVIEIIIQNPSVTIPEIVASLDMSIPGIEKIIRSLKEQKRLRRIGPDKGGHWEVSG